MKTIRLFASFSSVAVLLTLALFLSDVSVKAAPEVINLPDHTVDKDEAQTIQVALLLDTSNSMDGLIEQAKSQLWSILIALSQTRKSNAAPNLEIALYEYGNDGLPASSGHVRQVLSFTQDMDEVSAALFKLTTNGGEEYCGTVIQKALKQLEWTKHPDAVRLVFIAGNEGFDQGKIPYASPCANAKERDIIINTIFCGECQQGISMYWKDGATLTNGHYNCMNHNQATTYIETPYDKELQLLNDSLNQTYVPFGDLGNTKRKLQIEQDQNASKYGKANAANRAAFKATSNYNNASWDLVDAVNENEAILEESEALPESISSLSIEERKAKIKSLETQRSLVNASIQDISKKRQEYIAEQKTKNQLSKETDLEASILKAIQAQAAKKGFKTN